MGLPPLKGRCGPRGQLVPEASGGRGSRSRLHSSLLGSSVLTAGCSRRRPPSPWPSSKLSPDFKDPGDDAEPTQVAHDDVSPSALLNLITSAKPSRQARDPWDPQLPGMGGWASLGEAHYPALSGLPR